ncbi:MAG: hypothetical protein WCQ57_15950, partial [Verrucomicrobiota bacterium]
MDAHAVVPVGDAVNHSLAMQTGQQIVAGERQAKLDLPRAGADEIRNPIHQFTKSVAVVNRDEHRRWKMFPQHLAGSRIPDFVHFVEDHHKITADLPKKVVWDQNKLTDLVAKIPAEDRSGYIKTNYNIDERRYLMWPETLNNKTNGVTPRRFMKLSNT